MNIGGAVVRRLLTDSDVLVFNLHNCSYASDLTSIEALPQSTVLHTILRVDPTNAEATVAAAVQQADPDMLPAGANHSQLITRVNDRPGHDRRYAIDRTQISRDLGLQPRHSFK